MVLGEGDGGGRGGDGGGRRAWLGNLVFIKCYEGQTYVLRRKSRWIKSHELVIM